MWRGLNKVLINKSTYELLKKLAIDVGISIIIGVIGINQKRIENEERQRLVLHMRKGTRNGRRKQNKTKVYANSAARKTGQKRKSSNRNRSS